MPNFLKLTVWTHCPIAPAVVVWQLTPVGIGNSPPEMNVADSPEIAVRFGSASVRTTPALSIARRVAVTVGTPALFKAAAVRPFPGDDRRVICGERIGVVEIYDRGAVIHAGAEINAHLFDDFPLHFRDRDLQHHLVATPDRDTVDDLVAASNQPRCKIACLLRLDRARYRTGQNDALADAFDLNSGLGPVSTRRAHR